MALNSITLGNHGDSPRSYGKPVQIIALKEVKPALDSSSPPSSSTTSRSLSNSKASPPNATTTTRSSSSASSRLRDKSRSESDTSSTNSPELYELQEQNLKNILLRHELRGCKVMVLSVAGAYRKGKSFLLDFMLRYLTYLQNQQQQQQHVQKDNGASNGQSQKAYTSQSLVNGDGLRDRSGSNSFGRGGLSNGYDHDSDSFNGFEPLSLPAPPPVTPSKETENDWLEDKKAPLTGFSWRGGMERETTGIWLWSEPFVLLNTQGERVAILLMDTQGSFDSSSTIKQNATIFALSTMLSSVQIYNLSGNIQEDNLQHLQLFTEYGRLALADNKDVTSSAAATTTFSAGKPAPPFQSLMFLVRDWQNSFETGLGLEGGKKVLDKRLQSSSAAHPENANLRRHIEQCFANINCFLMPYPGERVAEDPDFQGSLESISGRWIKSLRELMPLLFDPRNVVTKQINGIDIELPELLDYFKIYTRIYASNELPAPKTMYEATAEANNLAAMHTSLELYRLKMEEVCGGSRPYIDPASIKREHANAKRLALDAFSQKKKMGGEEFSKRYQSELEHDIDTLSKEYERQNDQKNVMRSALTPTTLAITLLATYIFSSFFALIGLQSFANLVSFVMYSALAALGVWIYVRVSGKNAELGRAIDNGTYVLHTNVYQRLYVMASQRLVNEAIGVQLPISNFVQSAANSTSNSTQNYHTTNLQSSSRSSSNGPSTMQTGLHARPRPSDSRLHSD